MKKCLKCDKYKPYLSYPIKYKEIDGYDPICKECKPPIYKRKEYEPIVNLDNEFWRSVVGYEGLYEVSNFGRIKGMEKIRTAKGGSYIRNEQIIIQSIHHNGYKVIGMTKNGKRKSFESHRIIAMSFLPNPDNKAEVNHINLDRGDNSLENLEWTSRRENLSHGFKNKICSSQYRGVAYNKNTKKWIAYCSFNGKLIRMGYKFDNELDAARAYNNKLDELNIENKYKNDIY